MNAETKPKRESYTGWIIGVGLLLLLAAGIPVALKYFGPRETVMELRGDPGGRIVWRFQSGQIIQTGVTNLPVNLVFHAREAEFTAERTNYTGQLHLSVFVEGRTHGVIGLSGPKGGVRYKGAGNRWSISETR